MVLYDARQNSALSLQYILYVYCRLLWSMLMHKNLKSIENQQTVYELNFCSCIKKSNLAKIQIRPNIMCQMPDIRVQYPAKIQYLSIPTANTEHCAVSSTMIITVTTITITTSIIISGMHH